MTQKKEDEGKIYRKNGKVIVEAKGQQKIFKRKPIFLPNEYSLAVEKYLSSLTGSDVVVLGANGYSRISPENEREWGTTLKAYQAACSKLFADNIRNAQKKFAGMDIRIVHGASDLGVDTSLMEVARRLNIIQLGFSCPNFMLHVLDDDVPVHVAENQKAYADNFTSALNILFGFNGRIQAFEMDLAAALFKRKFFIPVNVIKTISTKGGPPAFGPNGEIEDAVMAYELQVRSVNYLTRGRVVVDWETIYNNTQEVTVDILRNHISPEIAFGY